MKTTFKQFISESINDVGILKAVFVIGLPGAGKSYTVKQLTGTIAPRVVNTDRATEYLIKKMGKESSAETWGDFQDTAHRVTAGSLFNYVNGLLPLFVDGTSNDVSNILHRMGILESLGYDIGVVYVKTDVETAIARAEARAKKIGRHVDADFIKSVNSRSEENAKYLEGKVDFFKTIVNDGDILDNSVIQKAFNQVQAFYKGPLKNPVGTRDLSEMKEKGYRYLTDGMMSKEVLQKKVDGWYRS